jgi:hypothetical protein
MAKFCQAIAKYHELEPFHAIAKALAEENFLIGGMYPKLSDIFEGSSDGEKVIEI